MGNSNFTVTFIGRPNSGRGICGKPPRMKRGGKLRLPVWNWNSTSGDMRFNPQVP